MLGLNRELWLLFALNLAIGFANQFVQPLFPLFLDGLGASEVEIGLVLSLANVVSMALMIPSGLLMNRIGKRSVLLLSVVLSSAPPLLISLARDWRVVAPLYIVFSASFSFFIVARMAIVSDNATPGNRATLFSVMNLAWPVGGIVAPIVSGRIVEGLGWAPIFQVASGVMAASLVPTLMLGRGGEGGDHGRQGGGSILGGEYLRFISVVFGFHFLMGVVEGVFSAVLPLYLRDEMLLSESLIGLFYTASSVLILLIQVPSGRLADRFGRRRVLLLSLLPLPFLFGAWGLVGEWWLLLALFTAASGFRSMTWPSSLAILTDFVPPGLLGSAVGIRMTSMRLGSTVGPLLAGYLYGAVGPVAPFLASAVVSAGMVVAALGFSEKRDEGASAGA